MDRRYRWLTCGRPATGQGAITEYYDVGFLFSWYVDGILKREIIQCLTKVTRLTQIGILVAIVRYGINISACAQINPDIWTSIEVGSEVAVPAVYGEDVAIDRTIRRHCPRSVRD